VTAVSDRLTRRVECDFGRDAPGVLAVLAGLADEAYGQDPERVQAALVLMARGDGSRFARAVDLLRIDWRDVLVGGGLGDGDWPRRLDEELA
jgi:hypothetical protein